MSYRRGTIAVWTAAAVLAAPASALGGTASVSDAEVLYRAEAQRNTVTISQPSDGIIRVRDRTAAVTPGVGCTRVNATVADCAARPGRIVVDVGTGNDLVAILVAVPARVAAGRGDDRIAGGPFNDELLGGNGHDVLRGNGGADGLDAGDGNDALAGGPGADAELGRAGNDAFDQGVTADAGDRLFGGSGRDRAVYSRRANAVTVSLDSVANDGEAAIWEMDDVRVDDVIGGAGLDELVGDSGVNRLVGGASNDRLHGQGGADRLEAGEGDDSIISRDRSIDVVSCGTGHDSVGADRGDAIARDCERQRRNLSMRVFGPSAPISRTGVLRLRVRCPDSASGECAGKVAVVTARRMRTRSGVRHVRLGARRFRLDSGETRELSVRFRRSALRFLRRQERLSLRARLENARDEAGASRRASRRFRLRAPTE